MYRRHAGGSASFRFAVRPFKSHEKANPRAGNEARGPPWRGAVSRIINSNLTNESQTTGAFTFTGTNFLSTGATLSLAGTGTVSAKGVFVDSGTDVPLDAFGQLTGKGKAIGNRLVISFANSLNSGTITLTRIA